MSVYWFPVFILSRIETGSGRTGFHWIHCAEDLTSRFEARGRATDQGQS